MTRRRIPAPSVLLCCCLAVVLIAAGVVAALAWAPTGSPITGPGTSGFRGVNWADPRDNYASDEVVPSGLDTSMTGEEVYRTASWVLSEFQAELGASTVRLPINPASVGTPWWDAYQGAIDAARDLDLAVILSYWESDTAKDGRIDDEAAYTAMWDRVVADYGDDGGVYLEPMNEPFGYAPTEWVDVATRWVQRYDGDVPRDRMVVSGSGYNDDVTTVGAAASLEGTLLSLHFYGFWADYTTEAAWRSDLLARLGDYAERTVISEAGSPMTIGLNYGNPEGDVSTAFLGALTSVAREQGIGLVYWPGLRTDDTYSLTRVVDPGDLEVTSESGLARIRWAWGLLDEEPLNDDPPAPPGEPISLAGAAQCLDVAGASSTEGAAVDVWGCNGGANQRWDVRDDGTVVVYGSMCLTDQAGSAVIGTCAGLPTQTWAMTEGGNLTVGADPTQCLAAQTAAEGSAVVVQECGTGGQEVWETG